MIRLDPDSIFQVVPDPDPALYTRPTKYGTGNLSVHNGTASRLFKHL